MGEARDIPYAEIGGRSRSQVPQFRMPEAANIVKSQPGAWVADTPADVSFAISVDVTSQRCASASSAILPPMVAYRWIFHEAKSESAHGANSGESGS